MRVSSRRNAAFPILAWRAVLQKSSTEVDVVCGSGVEVSDDFYFEGAWSGNFGSTDFATNYCFGSGCKIEGSYVQFIPPTHTLDNLYYCLTSNQLIVSNSLALLLNELGDKLDNHDYSYAETINRVYKGLDQGVSFLYTAARRPVRHSVL